MYTTPANLLFLIGAGVGTGVLGALLGTGGGVFLIPVLVIGLGVSMPHAIATSIVSVIATSSAVASTNVERGTANMPLGMTLEVATALGAMTGGITAGLLSSAYLELLFGFVILPTAWFMWHGRKSPESEETPTAIASAAEATEVSHSVETVRESAEPLGGSYYDESLGKIVTYRVGRLWAGMLVSFVAGNLSGLLGVGGGVFKVPALHLLCGVPINAAAATSNFMIGVTAAASAFQYYGRGEVRPALTAAVVLGILAGSAIGSRWSRSARGDRLRRLFAALLGVVACQMLYRGFIQ